MGAVLRDGAALTRMQQFVIRGTVDELSPLSSKDKVVVCLLQMNHSKAVDLVVPKLLMNHDVYDRFPSFVGVAPLQCVVNKSNSS